MSLAKIYRLQIILVALAMFSCNKLDKNPEKKDRVFNAINYDLEAEITKMKKFEVEIRRAKRSLKKMSAQDEDYPYMNMEILRKEQEVALLKQKIRLMEIQREKRVQIVREKTLRAFKRGETWSGDKDFEHYEAKRKLRSISMDWRARVPKMYDPTTELSDDDVKAQEKSEKERTATIEMLSK